MVVQFSSPYSLMSHSRTVSMSSSITLQPDEPSKLLEEVSIKLLASESPTVSKENVVDKPTSHILRSGKVKSKGHGIFRGIWRTKWLELREQSLVLRRRKGSSDHTVIHSRDIVTIERTSLRSHCLFLEVKGKKYWLSIESDAVLYGWLDDIIHHCHLSQTTTPENFMHHVHVFCDPITGCYQGLPIQWQRILKLWSSTSERVPKFIPSLYPD